MGQGGRPRANREFDEARRHIQLDDARVVSLIRLNRAAKIPRAAGCPSAALRPVSTAHRALLPINVLAPLSQCVAQIDRLVWTKPHFEWAFEAACVLHTLERGNLSNVVKAICADRIRRLRNTNYGDAADHYRRMTDHEFLEAFIQRCEPGWRWRNQTKPDRILCELIRFMGKPASCSAQLFVPSDTIKQMTDWTWLTYRNGHYDNQRVAKERSEMSRYAKAIRNRFVTADVPDSGMLLRFRRIRQSDPSTWLTLRDLKLATAIPERTIKNIVAKLRPQPKKREIVRIPLRHLFSKRGAVPKRYHPRFVLAVLNVFVSRLPGYLVKDQDRKRLHDIAVTVKRALTSKLSHSGSST